MKSVTVEQVMAWEPCGWDGDGYNVERVTELFAGRDTLTAADIAALDIPCDDKLWAILHHELVSDEQLHLLACDFAERVVHLCGDDPRPQTSINAKRAWLRGEISDDELAASRGAAWDAARAAAGTASRTTAWTAAWAAARDASRAAADSAARGAAWDAEQGWQLAHILEALVE